MDGLTITEVQRDIMVKNLERELAEIETRRKEVLDLLKQLRNYNPNATKQAVKASRDFTWKHVCLEVLKEADDLLRTDDVYQKFIEKYPKFQNEERKSIISSLSGSLSQLATAGKVVKIDNPRGTGNYWGLGEWVTNGRPKEAYFSKFVDKGVEII